MERLQKALTVDRLQRYGLSFQTASEINKLVNKEVSEQLSINPDVDNAYKKIHNFNNTNVDYFINDYVDKYNKFKRDIMTRIDIHYDEIKIKAMTLFEEENDRKFDVIYLTAFIQSVVETRNPSYLLGKIHVQKMKSISVITDINKLFTILLPEKELVKLISNYQDLKERYFRLLPSDNDHSQKLLENRKDIILQEVNHILGNNSLQNFYFYLNRMNVYYTIIKNYNDHKDNYYLFSNYEICLTSFLVIEKIFGNVIAAILYLNLITNTSYPELVAENNDVEKEYEDVQLNSLDTYLF